MPFINEYIPEEDKKKYNIKPGSNFYLTSTEGWTVDRERDIFLLPRTGTGPESEPGLRYWAFFWRGHLLDIRLKSIDSGCDTSGTHGWGRTKLLGIGNMPSELQAQRGQVVADLKDALTAHKALGVYSPYTSYEVTLETE
jgi:hypothetical protein